MWLLLRLKKRCALEVRRRAGWHGAGKREGAQDHALGREKERTYMNLLQASEIMRRGEKIPRRQQAGLVIALSVPAINEKRNRRLRLLQPESPDSLFYNHQMARSTLLERRHLVQTYTWRGVPSTIALTRLTFGFQALLERL